MGRAASPRGAAAADATAAAARRARDAAWDDSLPLDGLRAGEDRESANKEFQVTLSEQLAFQKMLTQAPSVRKDYYNKKAALLQKARQDPAGPPPPAGFMPDEKNAASGGVVGMI